MEQNGSNATYVLLNPVRANREERERLTAAWKCWREVWSNMLMELEQIALNSSDDFIRQDKIGALFYQGECLGVSGYRWVDLSLPLIRDDSYFRCWPTDLLEQIATTTPKVCIGSNIAVAPAWRRKRIDGLRISERLLAEAVQRFQSFDTQVMLGTLRNDRQMNLLGYKLGFRPLAQNIQSHNVSVDLVVFERSLTAVSAAFTRLIATNKVLQ